MRYKSGEYTFATPRSFGAPPPDIDPTQEQPIQQRDSLQRVGPSPASVALGGIESSRTAQAVSQEPQVLAPQRPRPPAIGEQNLPADIGGTARDVSEAKSTTLRNAVQTVRGNTNG